MTTAAQQALRMILCDYSQSTRFVFSCNNSTKIIEPLQSRCALIRFSNLEDSEIETYLRKICEIEQIKYEPKAIKALAFIAEGDMRNAVNNLQAVYVAMREITEQHVYRICDVPEKEKIEDLFKAILSKNSKETFERLTVLWNEDYCPHDLFKYLIRYIEYGTVFTPDQRLALLRIGNLLRFYEQQGFGTKIQLWGAVAQMINAV